MATRAARVTNDSVLVDESEGEVIIGYDVRERRVRALPLRRPAPTGGKPIKAAPDTSTQAVQELSSALELADHFAHLSARLRANLQQVREAFDALAFSTPAHSENPAASLSEHDEAVLREAGSLAHEMPPLAERASAKTAMLTVRLLEDALTVQQVADLLKVSTGRVRQRLSQHTLLGIDVAGNWKLPKFQFTDDGEVRGLDKVLSELPRDVHPLVLWRFLTTPHADLILEDGAVSPGTWMSTGGSVEPVLELAADLHSLA